MKLPSAEDFFSFEINDSEFMRIYRDIQSGNENAVNSYTKLCKILFLNDKTLSEYIHDVLIYSEQPLTEKYITTKDPLILSAVKYDIDRIKEICGLKASDIKKYLSETMGRDLSGLPEYESGEFPCTAEYFINNCAENGSGDFARYKAFVYLDSEKKLVPVKKPDPIRLSDLKRYETQRKQIVDNTLCFINNKPAGNVLLYGDRGTGKSSTIKALLNEYKTLRIVQLDKKQVSAIFDLYERLSVIPLHFIIFIDDLCFSEDDDGFFVLKQALEGSLSAKPDNVLIYATTNRRHIIKETAANRAENFVHKSDAVDDNMSLSERFGLFVTFTAPNKEQFVDIALKIARDRGINLDEEVFAAGVERFALKRGGRSPRIAKQYVDMLEGKLTLGMEL
ncbi:MAG: ATP-binding protein [Ruminococcaceae bacterium]|nr:ATP-binding protein [Oscillospiraceae bacterium]